MAPLAALLLVSAVVGSEAVSDRQWKCHSKELGKCAIQHHPDGFEYLQVQNIQESPCAQCHCCWRRSPEALPSSPAIAELRGLKAPVMVIEKEPQGLKAPVLFVNRLKSLISLYWGGYWPFHGRAHRPSESDGSAMQSAMPLLIATFCLVALITAFGIRRLARHSNCCLAGPPSSLEAATSRLATPLPLLQTDKLPLLLGSKPRFGGDQALLKNKSKGVSFDSDAEMDTDDEAI